MKRRNIILVILTIALLVGGGLFIMNGGSSQADEGKVTFRGDDFACQGCEQKIETTLNNIVGIENFKMNKSQNEVTVYYDSTIMEPEWIEKSLEASGFADIGLK